MTGIEAAYGRVDGLAGMSIQSTLLVVTNQDHEMAMEAMHE